MSARAIGESKVNFKLRDWVFSRQRYWGEPIPIVSCPHCGYVPVPESELPVRLPDGGELRAHRQRRIPPGGHDRLGRHHLPPVRRPCQAGDRHHASVGRIRPGISCGTAIPTIDDALAAKEALDYWMPVDWYNGGMEHTTLHLLYSRFWHKFLYDIGVVPTPEPYAKRTSHGMILGRKRGEDVQIPGQCG